MEIRIARKEELARVIALRFEVFVDEQGIPAELEIDEHDAHARHILAEEKGEVIGCARALLHDGSVQIGRLAVKKTYRGRGIGGMLCRFIMDEYRQMGYTRFWLHAQLRAAGFYQRLGFLPCGAPFMLDGLEHIQMTAECKRKEKNT